jgi:adenosylhomocysteine nucleosidase
MTTSIKPLGVIAALPEEIAHLGDALSIESESDRGGIRFRQGHLAGKAIVVADGGIGKVNAALVATLLLDHFGCRAVIFTGVAGGLDPALAIGDVVIADRMIQHDYGAIVGGALRRFRPGEPPIGEARHQLAFHLAPELRAVLNRAARDFAPMARSDAANGRGGRAPTIRLGTILTGDQFINCAATRETLFATFGAQAVEMEGAAIAQVAERFDAPCINVRCLSDLAGVDSDMDFKSFLSVAADTAAQVVRRLVPVL